MVIQTISKGYRVIKKLSESDQTQAYLCQEDQKNSKERYLVVGLTGRTFSKKIVPYFMELSSKKEKGDFLGCFTNKGGLWLVFRYYEYPRLSERMKEEFLPEERLEASRSMVERMVTCNLPHYLQYEGLNPDNVVVSDSLEVYFNFLLREPEFLGSCRITDVQQNLAACLEILFQPELEEKACGELEDFIGGLLEKEYTGYMGIYRDYRRLYDVLKERMAQGSLKGKGWLVNLWEALKGFLKGLRKVLYRVVIIGLIGLLIYQYFRPEPMPKSRVEFSRIGTLTIRQEPGNDEENPE